MINLLWENLVKCLKLLIRVLSRTTIWSALNELELGSNHSLSRWFFFDNSTWAQLWKNLLPNQFWLFWMWNNMLVDFSQDVFSQPPHVAHDHQKWLHMDLIHLLNACWILFSSFWQLFTNVFTNMPNVKLMTGIGALVPHILFYLHMSVCCNLFCFNISGLCVMQNLLKAIFLHSISIPTFSKLCYWHCNNFINTIFQEGIYQIFYIMPWAITSSFTTKYTWMWLDNFRNHLFSSLTQASLATPNK